MAVAGTGFLPLFVCRFVRTISQKRMQLGSTNWTYKRFTINPGNPFILVVSGQRKGHKTGASMSQCTPKNDCFFHVIQ